MKNDHAPQTSAEAPSPGVGSNDLFGEIVRKHILAVESLTEQQLAEVIRQAIASGDLMRHVMHDGSAQTITYIPYRETSRLRDKYNELLHALEELHTVCECATQPEVEAWYRQDRIAKRARANAIAVLCGQPDQSP